MATESHARKTNDHRCVVGTGSVLPLLLFEQMTCVIFGGKNLDVSF
jgi:hypothetical protein